MATTKKTLNELREEALDVLKNDDDVFCEMVNEMDSWNGYADGFRCYPMYEIDDWFCNMKVSEFLDKLDGGFDHTQDYFVDTIYGLESTNDPAEIYRDNVEEEDLLDNIIDKKNHLYFSDSDFEELIDSIINYDEDEEEKEE